MNQTNNAWDSNLTKVSSMGEISKLMPALTPREEVQPEPVQEKKMNKKEATRAALEYSIAHPSESLVDVAKMYSITAADMYNARYWHKKRLLKGAKKTKATKVPAVVEKQWNQVGFSTSAEPVKQDVVNHPAHYKIGGIETIDFIEAKQLTYNLGNVVKYITRAGVKNKATHIEDLEKAAWYLNREIANLKGGA